MSYFLADQNGYLGDFATNAGLADLEQMALPALGKFLDAGEADAALTLEIIAELDGAPPDAKKLAPLFENATPPIILSDGTEEEA